MQVNNIQGPNFGMSLRIKPEAEDALKKMSSKEIDNLWKIGDDLKNTTHYHLEIGKNGKSAIVSALGNKYENIKLGEPGFVDMPFYSDWTGQMKKSEPNHISYMTFSNHQKAVEAYNTLNKSSELERNAKITKILDKNAEETDIQIHNDMIKALMEKFGVKTDKK